MEQGTPTPKETTMTLTAEYNRIQDQIARIVAGVSGNHYTAPSNALIARKQELERILGINQD